MTDKEKLNRLMAEAIRWQQVRAFSIEDGVDLDIWVSEECLGPYPKVICKIVDWNPTEHIEQATMVVTHLIATHKECWCSMHNRVSEERIWEVFMGLTLSQQVSAYSVSLAEAICLAVEAALKEEQDDAQN